MKEKTMNTLIHFVLPMSLGIVVAIIVFATRVGKTLPLISTPHAGLIALLVVGLTMCFLGGVGQIGASGRWDSPAAIAGCLLGGVTLIIIVSALAGWRLPLVPGESQAVAAVGILIGVKLLIGAASFFFRWL